eukprot:scaffold23195_cov113-Isochrysis_galbana.AAC.7
MSAAAWVASTPAVLHSHAPSSHVGNAQRAGSAAWAAPSSLPLVRRPGGTHPPQREARASGSDCAPRARLTVPRPTSAAGAEAGGAAQLAEHGVPHGATPSSRLHATPVAVAPRSVPSATPSTAVAGSAAGECGRGWAHGMPRAGPWHQEELASASGVETVSQARVRH